MNDLLEHIPIAILGAGVAGLCAARRIEAANPGMCVVFERGNKVGGMGSSFTLGDCTFDIGIHGLYTKDPQVLGDFHAAVAGQDHEIRPSIMDIWQDRIVPHPVQSHLYGLPQPIALNCVIDFIEAQRSSAPTDEAPDYRTWCLKHLGRSLSEVLVFPYIRKFWTVGPEELIADLGPRTRVPTVQEILRGALIPSPQDVDNVSSIRYPTSGGFGAYARGFAKGVPVRTKKCVTAIDAASRRLSFEDGSTVSYGALISTIPLPTLIRLLAGTPEAVASSCSLLRATSLALVSFVLRKPSRLECHWAYSYDPDCVFSRITLPSRWAENNGRGGTGSVQAEVYYRGSSPTREHLEMSVRRDLRRVGIIGSDDEIAASDVRWFQYANVIYDHNRSAALKTIAAYLKKVGIRVAGRYGLWDHSLVDEVKRNAEAVADAVVGEIAPRR